MAAVTGPTKNLKAREAGLLYMPQQPCCFSQVSMCFAAILGCSDCVYDEISIVATKLYVEPRVKNPLGKKSYKFSNLVFLGVGSPPIFPIILNTLPLSDLDVTSYIDSFWDRICAA